MSNQSDRATSCTEAIGADPTGYEASFHLFWDDAGIDPGTYNERFIIWAKDATGLDSDSIVEQQAEIASIVGVSTWDEVTSLEDVLSTMRYFFGTGISGPATIANAWKPTGYGSSITISYVQPSSGVLGVFGDPGGAMAANGDAGGFIYSYNLYGGGAGFAFGNDGSPPGTKMKFEARYDPDALRTYINGVEFDSAGAPWAAGQIRILETNLIGDSANGAAFIGPIWNMVLTDRGAHNNGRFYELSENSGTIFSDIPLHGAFSIRLTWTRTDATGTNQRLLGHETDTTYLLRAYDQDGSPADALRLSVDGGEKSFNALENLDYGQSAEFIFSRDGAGDYFCTVDGQPASGTPSASLADGVINSIGGGSTGGGFQETGLGYISDIEIVTELADPNERTTGFFDFDADANNVHIIDRCSMKNDEPGVNGYGLMSPFTSAAWDFNSDGFTGVASNGETVAVMRWGDGLNGVVFPPEWTVQYKIEKGFFANVSQGAELGYGLLTNSADAGGYDIKYLEADSAILSTIDGLPFKTVDQGVSDFVTVTFSKSVANGLEMYLDGCLRQRWPSGFNDDPGTFIGPCGQALPGITASKFSPYRIKDVLWLDIPTTFDDTVSIKMAGDSIHKWGDHDSGYTGNEDGDPDDPNNNPFFKGYRDGSDTSYYARFDFMQSTTASMLIGSLAQKGWYCDDNGVISYARGGVVIDPANNIYPFITGDLSQTIDALLGENGPNIPPGGSQNSTEIAVIACGQNDILSLNSQDLGPGGPIDWATRLQDLVDVYLTQLDRLIDDNRTRFVLIQGIVSDTNVEPFAGIRYTQLNNLFKAQVDGYRDMVKYADVLDGYTVAMRQDTIHPNAEGMRYLTDSLNALMPSRILSGSTATFTYPVNEGSGYLIRNTNPTTGEAYNGRWKNDSYWVDTPDNSRQYPMNDETQGANLPDRLDPSPPTNDAIINPYDPAGWQEL